MRDFYKKKFVTSGYIILLIYNINRDIFLGRKYKVYPSKKTEGGKGEYRRRFRGVSRTGKVAKTSQEEIEH